MIFFSTNLKFLRKKHGLQQEELAKILNVKANTVSNYERGVSQPDYKILLQITEYFNITAQQILYDNISTENNNIPPQERSRFLINNNSNNLLSYNNNLCLCIEKDKRIDELNHRINEQSQIINYFLQKNSS